MSEKYFLDCGGNDGCSVRKFLQWFPQALQFTIHSFEPNPNFSESYRTFSNLFLHPEAVWIADTHLPFYLGKTQREDGSSLYRNKTTGLIDKENYITVGAIDFSGWIDENFVKEDYIILKMDIEGAEYEVLNKMIQDGTIDYIDELFIEFHYQKIGLSEADHSDLIARLKSLGCHILPWDALEF